MTDNPTFSTSLNIKNQNLKWETFPRCLKNCTATCSITVKLMKFGVKSVQGQKDIWRLLLSDTTTLCILFESQRHDSCVCNNFLCTIHTHFGYSSRRHSNLKLMLSSSFRGGRTGKHPTKWVQTMSIVVERQLKKTPISTITLNINHKSSSK